MVAYKYELVAYGKTFELTEDSLADPMTHFAVAFHCWMPDCVEADVSPANSVIEDNGVLHVKIPFTVPPVCAPEWGEMGETVRIIQQIIRDMAEANEHANTGEEDAGEKTINGLVDANTGEVIVALKRIPLETPKRAFFRVEDNDWMCADLSDLCGFVNAVVVRGGLTDYLNDLPSGDLEDDIEELLNADDDVEIDFYASNSSYSYTKREVLDAMGDWETCVSENIDILVDDVADTILGEVQYDCTEEGQTIETRIGEVQFRLLAVDENGDPIEEDD